MSVKLYLSHKLSALQGRDGILSMWTLLLRCIVQNGFSLLFVSLENTCDYISCLLEVK